MYELLLLEVIFDHVVFLRFLLFTDYFIYV